MDKHYKTLTDTIDTLMVALRKQKNIGLDLEVMRALSKVTKARVEYKKAYNAQLNEQQTHIKNHMV